MGIAFYAVDTTRTRTRFDGSLAPVHVDLGDHHLGFHEAGAAAWLTLMENTNRLGGRLTLSDRFRDNVGGVSVVDARRAIMVARARFGTLEKIVANDVNAAFAFLGLAHDGKRVVQGPEVTSDSLKRRLESFAEFVEAAAAAGADRVEWS